MGDLNPVAHRCENCNALLRGEYCAACGQRVEHHDRSLGAFLREAFESLTHADSRVWRTLGLLLLKPGFLTRDYLDGRRARQLPPFRLYLLLSLLFFLLAALTPRETVVVAATRADAATAERRVRECQFEYEGPGSERLRPKIQQACEQMRADGGRSMSRAFFANLPRALFIFLPLLALLMKLLYWRPKRYYVEHLLFFVHNHSFLFLLFAIIEIVELILPFGWVETVMGLIAAIYVPYYIYRAMRRVYSQSRLLTLTKYVVVAFSYVVVGGVMAVATVLYSVFTL